MNKTKLLILSALAAGLIWYFFPKDPSWPVAHSKRPLKTAIAFGDSLTAGATVGPEENFVALLSKKLKIPIQNLGQNGLTTKGAIKKLPALLKDPPDLILLTLGGNDLLRRLGKKTTLTHLSTLFSRLTAKGIMVVYIGISPPLTGSWSDDIRDLCKTHRVLLVPQVMNGFWGNPEWMNDQVHPNAKGHQKMAERIYTRLAPYLNP